MFDMQPLQYELDILYSPATIVARSRVLDLLAIGTRVIRKIFRTEGFRPRTLIFFYNFSLIFK